MPKFDLSNAADFSRITGQTLTDVNAFFGGRNPNEWDIKEAKYNGIPFHVFESKKYVVQDPSQDSIGGINPQSIGRQETITWEGALSQVEDVTGRRKVKYQFPYRDGQTTDDLGRKPFSFTVDAVIFGPRYIEGFRALINEFDKPTPGKLTHPIRGDIICAVDDINYIHRHDSRKSVEMQIVFIEHNFTIGDLRQKTDSSVKSALSAALSVFSAIDRAISAVEIALLLPRAIKNRIQSLLAAYKGATGRSLTSMNVTFNRNRGGQIGIGSDSSVIDNSVDIPSLLPVNLGGTRLPDGSILEDNFVVVRSVSDPFNSIPVDIVNRTVAQLALASADIQKQVSNLWSQAAEIIREIDDNGASLELYETTLSIRETAVMVQQVYDTGIASSSSLVADYKVPRLMSLREVAFENGISVDRVEELSLLNPEILSNNYIEPGVIVKVPTI
jgi:hypothetical protein